MKKEFSKWFSEFTDSISTYEYYSDFKKVYNNVNKIRIELNLMNSLIGSKNISDDFDALFKKYPEIRSCLPVLIAVREKELKVIDGGDKILYDFKNTDDVGLLKKFMEKTGLFDLISNHIINNLIDYATGVEIGLDSNGRKNRGGLLMDYIVEGYLKKENLEYYKKLYISDIEKKWAIDMSALSNMGKSKKRFNFVVKTPSTVYGIETNFYSASGSKLNETARSYKTLALGSKNIPGFKFAWVTDGFGWSNAKYNLEETFEVMDYIFNLKELENGAFREFII